MPAAQKIFVCCCVECAENGGIGHDGTPKGVRMPWNRKASHLARVYSSRPSSTSTTTLPTSVSPLLPSLRTSVPVIDRDLEVAASNLFFDTVLDERFPSDSSHSTRLWTQPGQTGAVSNTSNSAGIGEILCHLHPSSSTFQQSPPSTAESTHPINISDNSACRRERSHLNKVALEILDEVERRASSLLISVSQVNSPYHQLELECQNILVAFKNVTRDTQTVRDRKWFLEEGVLRDLQTKFSDAVLRAPHSPAPLLFNSSSHFELKIDRLGNFAQVAVFLGVVCSAVMGVSHKNGDFILGIVRVLISLVFGLFLDSSSSVEASTLNQIPRSIEVALAKFDLEGQTTMYAVCPACHCTYKPCLGPTASFTYPETCSNVPKAGEPPCGELLLDPRSHQPVKKFIYHHFFDYLAGLLAREDLERHMDHSCNNLLANLDHPPSFVSDIFEAQFFRNFKGPTGDRLFIDRGNEGRYPFALFVDSFHIDSMRIRGPKGSWGIISLAPLSLPSEIRYKPENMYVAGIIEGPNNPHLTELNHYLRPLIDDLKSTWENGVRFSRTALHLEGRVARCAIAMVVCNLPAARKTAQFAHHTSHHYCATCYCYGCPTVLRTDFTSPEWRHRDQRELQERAEAWKNATNEQQREDLFSLYGTRWSELWHLPYWDQSRQLVVEPGHAILEGLAQYQFQNLLGLSSLSAEKPRTASAFSFTFQTISKDSNSTGLKATEIEDIPKIHTLLLKPIEPTESAEMDLLNKLANKHLKLLAFVSDSLGIQTPGSRRVDYANSLVGWRKTKPLDENARVVTPDVISHVQKVIKNTVTPSWIQSVPYNFGEASAGTIKMDEWRTLTTIYFPLALIRLWGYADEKDKVCRILDHTMALVSAVTLACKRTMTQGRAMAYRTSLATWVRGLDELYADTPNKEKRANIHVSFHIYNFLLWFGPVHSWWCFPFERLIGYIQRQPSNRKTGERENTLLQTFIKASKLKRWLSRPDCPAAIAECKVLFDKVHALKYESSKSTELGDKESNTNVPSELRGLIGRRSAVFYARICYKHVVFCRDTTHLGNSLVLFFPRGDQSSRPVPGCIRYIFEDNNHFSLVLNRYVPLAANEPDPFAMYPYFPAQMYSTKFSQLELADLAWVFGHFAKWQVAPDKMVVLSLSRD